MRKGIFITFEGTDGCGKTTHARLLYLYLRKNGRSAVFTREPGGTPLAESVRKILLDSRHHISPLAELLLYEASRAEHVAKIILPALKAGKTVVCDRFFDATVAYQGYGRGLDLKMIEQLNAFASRGLTPDLTILLDVAPEKGLTRIKKLRKNDRMEKEKISFYRKVRSGYLSLARKFSGRIKVFSSAGSVAETQGRIRDVITEKL